MAQILKMENGENLKVNGQDVYESTGSGVVKQVDLKKRKMTMRGTDETQDRDGDIVMTNGGDLENYRKNPVFLWAHDYRSVPLARAEKVIKHRDPVHMEFHLIYPTLGLHPFADMILELYNEGIINASSIGFIPIKWDLIQQEGERKPNEMQHWNPRTYTKWELLELSGCPVPCNPNALQNALKAKSFMDQPFDMVQRWVQGHAQPPRPKSGDDILNELFGKGVELKDETKPFMIQVPEKFCVIEEEKAEENLKEECGTWAKDETGQDVQFEEKEFITKEEVDKPFPSEHSCRLVDPGGFDKFARKNCYIKHESKCIDCIFGIKDNKSKMQAMRYPKDVWTAAAAKSHCGNHDGSFEAAKEVQVEAEKIVYTIDALDAKSFEDYMEKFLGKIKVLFSNAQEPKQPSGPDLALEPTDPGSREVSEGKGAAEAILDEAFNEKQQGKITTFKLSNPTPPVQYDSVKGVNDALKELTNVVLTLKGVLKGVK